MSHLILQYSEPPEERASITSDRVMQVISEIHNAGRNATREGIAEVIGVTPRELDDHVKTLLGTGQIRRLYAGCYEPIHVLRPPRAVGVKRLPTGIVKITMGNDEWSITPEEERMLAASLTGAYAQFHDLTRGRDLADRFRELQKQHHELQEDVRRHLGIPKQAEIG